ncbi:SAP domain-containing ribonucleoprotein isoform X1 [Salmo salar]|uniref:Nuclear protein Hcc-1 n=1 Tax=Salmo salar TaxID=8030 RepID=B5X839_SALSA|nr:SAP domain-containing ribonucleoprotein isoform X1 [Salmo salar]ACI67009.1 Nuclear protein Hcc-1 [Salmo salar]|eukprot:XP_013991446.1 PREDICTED: SAP domain-containing ribonucleoprotein-like isoform X1 [Salmo salar]
MAEIGELQKLKLAELKHECEARGLDVKGNKVELITRLQAHLEEHEDDIGLNEDDVLGDEPKYLSKDVDAITGDNDEKPLAVSETAEKKVVKITPPVSVDERLQKRADRFNVPASADSKKAIRAARFGLSAAAPPTSTTGVTVNKSTPVSVEQLKKRAERFGGNVSSVSKKVEEDEKLKKRKERFGILTGAVATDVEAKKQKRSERFGNVTV